MRKIKTIDLYPIRSDEELNEFLAISVSLSAEDVEEDKDNGVVCPISGILDNGVSEQEDDSDIFEAVTGQQEGDSGSLNNVTQNWLNFVAELALLIHSSDFLN